MTLFVLTIGFLLVYLAVCPDLTYWENVLWPCIEFMCTWNAIQRQAELKIFLIIVCPHSLYIFR